MKIRARAVLAGAALAAACIAGGATAASGATIPPFSERVRRGGRLTFVVGVLTVLPYFRYGTAQGRFGVSQ